MMTLLYGDKPEVDVEPGNRVDTESDRPPVSLPPMEYAPEPRVFALHDLGLGLVAAAAVLAGLTIAVVALVWWQSMG